MNINLISIKSNIFHARDSPESNLSIFLWIWWTYSNEMCQFGHSNIWTIQKRSIMHEIELEPVCMCLYIGLIVSYQNGINWSSIIKLWFKSDSQCGRVNTSITGLDHSNTFTYQNQVESPRLEWLTQKYNTVDCQNVSFIIHISSKSINPCTWDRLVFFCPETELLLYINWINLLANVTCVWSNNT